MPSSWAQNEPSPRCAARTSLLLPLSSALRERAREETRRARRHPAAPPVPGDQLGGAGEEGDRPALQAPSGEARGEGSRGNIIFWGGHSVGPTLVLIQQRALELGVHFSGLILRFPGCAQTEETTYNSTKRLGRGRLSQEADSEPHNIHAAMHSQKCTWTHRNTSTHAEIHM